MRITASNTHSMFATAVVALALALPTALPAADAPVSARDLAPAATAPADKPTGAATASADAGKETTKGPVWPYVRVARPALPEVKQHSWARQPLDNFVLARIEAQGLKPSGDADRAQFIRRATLDAWGLLPTPEETAAFVADRASDAYEKLVDRLLASPHFGERQARRWLDLARYADSSGFQNDQTRPNSWRYRDYVITAFNQDKPFDRFIREQVAGDELYPDSQEARIATGFLANYPDNANSRDLVQRKYQIETDMTDNVGEVFLAQSVGCARCHNHKFDKISQKEYFQLQAFFANTSFDERAPLLKGTETTWDQEYDKRQAAWLDATKGIRERQKAILDQVREAGLKFHKERYLTDSREAIFKPEAQWTPLDRWVNHRLQAVTTDFDIAQFLKHSAEDKGSPEYDAANEQRWKDYQALGKELARFDKLKPASGSKWLTTATELGHADSPPTRIRFTGIHERPLDEVQPGLPALWGKAAPLEISPSATSSGRRSALANWLAHPDNPLVARVYVNRVWAQYFDKGIVPTVADFGRAGQKPSNPELLDFLASDFVAKGFSVKQLHRGILLSSTYREASTERADVRAADPDNKLLAVFPRKRLEAEELRDSLLYASGLLVDRVGGPAVFPPIYSGASIGTSQDFLGNRAWTVSDNHDDWYRRSVYVFERRSLPYPITQNFDPADPSKAHHKRDVTTTPLQALTLFNSEVVQDWARALAGRVVNEAGSDPVAQQERLWRVLFARAPTREERQAVQDYLHKDAQAILERATTGKFELAVPTGLKDPRQFDPVRDAALVDLVHTVFNANEFAYRF